MLYEYEYSLRELISRKLLVHYLNNRESSIRWFLFPSNPTIKHENPLNVESPRQLTPGNTEIQKEIYIGNYKHIYDKVYIQALALHKTSRNVL